MFIGIDVGGTTTNAVLTGGRSVVAKTAVPTVSNDLTGSVLAALDGVIKHTNPAEVERIVLSTTVITNLLAEGKADRVGLVLIPGPGADPDDYELPPFHVVGGAIDYRGREIAPLDTAELRRVGATLRADDLCKVAVVGKFCQRNPAHEKAARKTLRQCQPDLIVECGHRVSGRLNFPRRAATTLLTLATRDRYREFASDIGSALEQRGLRAPVFVLKADGGTLPLQCSLDTPVETIFSGPAASTMGALALVPAGESFVVLDVGGTTTDLALVLDGRPLLSSKGARVKDLLTHVRAFAVKSLPIGGDSAVRVVETAPCGRAAGPAGSGSGGADSGGDACGTPSGAAGLSLTVGPDRVGPPACLGGVAPTPTDALRVLGVTDLGDEEAAQAAMTGVADALGLTLEEAAHAVVDLVAVMIAEEVDSMFVHWRDEPVYRIREVVAEKQARPTLVVGIGGGAPWLARAAAALLGGNCVVPEHAEVANALGAALSRPTLSLTLRVDTSQGSWATEEDGMSGRVGDSRLGLEGAERLALDMLAAKADDAAIGDYAAQAEITHSEVFNMVRGQMTVGRLLSATAEIPAGILSEWEGAS
jgi:N-methylhydantoinase A/oxoprolinase/acetone carboxylase beta subunit